VPGVHSLADMAHIVRRFAEHLGGLGLIVLDTSAAYFPGEDENSNKELGDYARFLRTTFCTLPGKPTVIVNCHPTKHASAAEDLLPRGGGAFIAEVDGNLTLVRTDKIMELHWAGKFRGADFAPITLELLSQTAPPLKDSRGREVYTVICKDVPEDEREAKQERTYSEAERVLKTLVGGAESVRAIARELGWVSPEGKEHTSKVSRYLGVLQNEKLAKKEMGHWKPTEKAMKASKKRANGHA